MPPDFERTAAAMVDGTTKAIQAALAPVLRRLEELEARPLPERGEKGDRGEQGEPGRDGVGVRDGFVQRDGICFLSLSDGTMRDLGVVVGKDGVDGKDGETGPQGERGEQGPQGEKGAPGARGDAGLIGEKGIDGRDGRDGTDGKDGRDGFDLEAFDCQPIDERTLELTFTGAGQVHRYELEFPVIIDRGVYKADETYKRGDGVTWGGSWWIAQVETAQKPDSTDSGWRLAVKKGRDGKDAKAT